MIRIAALVGGGVLFALLATANAAGYRYGVADQAFYIPVITHALEPAAFPRDGTLIDAQGRLMVLDEILAGAVRSTGVSLEALFLGGYLVSVALIWAGLVLIGTHVYANPWATVALAAAFTMRHRIPQTSANSFEPYFHPRMLAFGIGTLAVAAVLRQQPWVAVALVALCGLVHITTGLWVGMLVGVALAVLDPRLRKLAAVGAGAALAALAWAAAAGPLRAATVSMDDTWLEAVASKDSLFATGWPLWAWLANFGFLALLWWAHRWRVRRGVARAEDGALVWGATALALLFVATLPAVAAGWSLAVQFQISRIFWLIDFLATVYVIAVVADTRTRATRARVLAVILMAVSAARGTYVLLIEHPERALFETRIPDSPWEDAMRWLRTRPLDVHVLADPGHAWKYGTSVRVAAERDVLLEEVKDSALAIYSREVAVRVVDRILAIGDFGAMTAGHAQELARRYQLDYLVTEAPLPLPEVHRNAQFRIYALR